MSEIINYNKNGIEMNMAFFGHGDKNAVIIPGLSVTPVTPSADSVEKAYGVFSEKYRVILVDRRKNAPVGYSFRDMARDTEEVLASIGISRYSLMGMSQGGMIGMYMAVYFPESVEKAVFCSSSYEITSTFDKVNKKWIELAEKGDKRGLAEFFGKTVYSPGVFENCKEMLIKAGDGYTSGDLEHFLIMARAFYTIDILPELHKINCPVMVLGSTGDRVFGADASVNLSNKLNCEKYIYDSRYGHAVYDEADDFRDRIFSFLEK